MSTTFFIPPPKYLQRLELVNPLDIAALCERVGIRCQASGAWINRRIEIKHGSELFVEAEPGDWGAIRITMPKTTKLAEAKLALVVLAYSLNDLVARQSVKGHDFARVPIPKGRIKTGRALSNAERQKLYRERVQ